MIERHYLSGIVRKLYAEHAGRADRQTLNLGIESHDDLNDACVYLIQGLANQGLELPKIQWIEAYVTDPVLILIPFA